MPNRDARVPSPAKAPPGDLAAILAQLREALGADAVLSADEDIERLSRTTIPYREIPSAIVYPGDAEQVGAVMALANEHGVPVWPVSRGNNWGYGSRSACYPGGITMILERMNRIHHVDEELAYAVIEPGVTYDQLNRCLKERGIALWADCAGSTVNASVIGNALDRGRGLTPYGDHFGNLCGMEVVLPDGQRLVTGGGSAEGSHTSSTYKWGTGPYLDGLFSQSNLGIVVKTGIWLMPAPECFDFFVFEFNAPPAQFAPFIDDLRGLVFSGALKSHPHLANTFAMLCIVDQYPSDLLEGGRYLSDAALARWQARHGVADWTFGAGLYGSRAEVRTHKRRLKKTLSRYGRLTFAAGWEDPGIKGRLMLGAARQALRLMGKSPSMLDGIVPAINLFKGIPTDHFVRQAYFKSHPTKPHADIDPPRDGCGLLWIGPVLPFHSRHVKALFDIVVPLYERYEFDYFVELIVEGPRSLIALFGIFFDKESPEESERAMALYTAIHDAAYDGGYPPYRAVVAGTEHALDCNPAVRDVVASIKGALDPGNILAPGRYGAPAGR